MGSHFKVLEYIRRYRNNDGLIISVADGRQGLQVA